jgi:protein-disulfide isomerase
MAEAGRSLKPFYLLLGGIAVVGVVLIVRLGGGGNPAAKLVVSSCDTPPLGSPPPKGVVLGSDSAKVEITEFSDFECPYCARFSILTMPDIRQRLIPGGRVRWRYLDFPLDGHVNSPAAHLAASCALAQGKFWDMHDALYMHQNDWVSEKNPQRRFLEYANRIGLNVDSFRVCVREQRPWPQIQANKCEGMRLNVQGTPTFFVNGRMLQEAGPAYDDFKHIVDSLTAAPAAAASPAATKRR